MKKMLVGVSLLLSAGIGGCAHQKTAATHATGVAMPPVVLCLSEDSEDFDLLESVPSYPEGPEEFFLSQGWWMGEVNRRVVSYSFVPDGTTIPAESGINASGPSDFFSRMRTEYASYAPDPINYPDVMWQSWFHDAFARMSEVSGIDFVYEPNDDGANMYSAYGANGVRGDIRIGGKSFSAGTVLAYARYPSLNSANGGDAVFNTNSACSTFISDINDFIRQRAVIAHELGHTVGLVHVCPQHNSKRMEPLISYLIEGPQHDDIRGFHALYGDVNEPNNSTGTATALGEAAPGSPINIGAVPTPDLPFVSTVSFGASESDDYYSFTVPGRRLANIVLQPVGLTYLNDLYDGNPTCTGSTSINSLAINNLNFQVYGPGTGTLIATANSQSAGIAESVTDLVLPSAGTYYLRVTGATTMRDPQMYTATITTREASINIALPNGPVTEAPSQTDVPFAVTISGVEGSVTGTPELFFRSSAGAFGSVALVANGGTSYTATLPGFACGQTIEYYISADVSGGGTVTLPYNAPTNFFSAVVGVTTTAFDDDFESNLGWSVSNTAHAGVTFAGGWSRSLPSGNTRYSESLTDFDGSGKAYFTDANLALGNAYDVDGITTLTSPTIDISAMAHPVLSYARWVRCWQHGADPRLEVRISSDNGSTWTLLETVYDTTGWVETSWDLAYVPSFALTSQFKVQFKAQDNVTGSLILECGIDAVSVKEFACVGACASVDFDHDGSTGTDFDIEFFLDCWLNANCCSTCGTSDFNGDGDSGTDADFESFFSVLSAGPCVY